MRACINKVNKSKMHRYTTEKVKESWICIARPIVRSSPLKRSGMYHTVFTLQLHHTCLYLIKHSPDGATTDSDISRLITDSFIDPKRMKG